MADEQDDGAQRRRAADEQREAFARREREINEAVLAACRAINDLCLVDKFVALERLEYRLEVELAGHELAMVERLN
jgi:hypothetical protein